MILAIDTGLGSFGWAVVEYNGFVRSCGAMLLPPLEGERVHQSFVRRIVQQGAVHRSHLDGCSLIAGESLSFPRSSKAIAAVSMCWGLILGLSAALSIPIEDVAPKRWQRAFQGSKGKIDQAVVASRVSDSVSRHCSQEVLAMLYTVPPKLKPHMLDACGIGKYAAVRVAARKRRGGA